MLDTNFTNIRDIQRNYKKVAEELNKTKKPTIVMSKNQPQFAIVSLDMLKVFDEPQGNTSAQTLLDLAAWARSNGIKGPHDLSERHNDYTWDKE